MLPYPAEALLSSHMSQFRNQVSLSIYSTLNNWPIGYGLLTLVGWIRIIIDMASKN